MSEVWVFVDLDGTLVHSRRRAAHVDGTLGYTDRAGEPLGLLPHPAGQLLEAMRGADRVIPVTDRGAVGLSRLAFDFHDVALICRAGALLRADRTADPEFAAYMAAQLAPYQAELGALAGALGDLPVRLRRVGHAGVQSYIAVRDPQRNEARIRALDLRRLCPAGWHFHQLHDQISFAPPPLTKEAGVAWLLRDGRPGLVIGAGDAHVDAGFLKLCDFAITPGDSQLTEAW